MYLNIQSISDIITNSSSEVFIVEKDIMLDIVKEFDEPLMDNIKVTKITRSKLFLNNHYRYITDFDIYEIPVHMILEMLGISFDDAIKEGLPFKKINSHNDGYYDWDFGDYSFEFTDKKPDESDDEYNLRLLKKDKEYRNICCDLAEKYQNFVYNHIKEVEEKIIGLYQVEVEDHFTRYEEFADIYKYDPVKDIKDKIHYYESRH